MSGREIAITSNGITRRALLGAACALLSGCIDRQSPSGFAQQTAPSRQLNYPIEPYDVMYGGIEEYGFRIPPIPYERLNPDYLRQIVHDPTEEPVGTIVIDANSRYLYVILEDRKAVRYGIAIGPEYYHAPMKAVMGRREQWPVWYAEAPIAPKKKNQSKKLPAGLENPYGARALHIRQNSANTRIVIHGTAQWQDIGNETETGCIAMLNQDVIDLDQRTKPGARVIIL
ncbi:L,D-transpeptidase [Hoeflea sp. TYP-13]|uniref:L,D-transpeptidase n=1 Tax=Hoeflea sp. TYP-13 TaxID=3230023 RepID=UPI0034C6DB93